jgi:hypothetical protein
MRQQAHRPSTLRICVNQLLSRQVLIQARIRQHTPQEATAIAQQTKQTDHTTQETTKIQPRSLTARL